MVYSRGRLLKTWLVFISVPFLPEYICAWRAVGNDIRALMGLCSARFLIALVLMYQGVVIEFIAHHQLLSQVDKSLVCHHDEYAESTGAPLQTNTWGIKYNNVSAPTSNPKPHRPEMTQTRPIQP